jgi:hypothetical protein
VAGLKFYWPQSFYAQRWVKAPTVDDCRKVKRVLGYLQMLKCWNKLIDRYAFDRINTYIDASFGCHVDGESQLAWHVLCS